MCAFRCVSVAVLRVRTLPQRCRSVCLNVAWLITRRHLVASEYGLMRCMWGGQVSRTQHVRPCQRHGNMSLWNSDPLPSGRGGAQRIPFCSIATPVAAVRGSCLLIVGLGVSIVGCADHSGLYEFFCDRQCQFQCLELAAFAIFSTIFYL